MNKRATRRNAIAHNYDRDNSYNRTAIDKEYTDKIIKDISNLVESVLKEVNRNIIQIQQTAW